MKISLQSGIINFDLWKKKIEEQFNTNKYFMHMAMMDSLTTSQDRIIMHTGLPVKWPKIDAVKYIVEQFTPHLEKLDKGIKQKIN